MIQLNELRIGNICRIYEETTIITLQDLRFVDSDNKNPKNKGINVQPILINDNILLKNGIKKDKDGVFQLSNSVFWLDTGFIQIANGYTPIMNIPCKYVHQLQNIWFSLRGEEFIFIALP